MNNQILFKIKKLCDESKLYHIPISVSHEMMRLERIILELSKLSLIDNHHTVDCIIHQIEKSLVQLIIKISNTAMPDELIYQFSDVITSFIDYKIQEKKSVENLTNLFGQLGISMTLEESMNSLKM